MSNNDPVNHPDHYTAHPSGIECIEITEHLNFCLGSAVKYIWRCDHKGKPIEDLKKAVAYLNREIDRRIEEQKLESECETERRDARIEEQKLENECDTLDWVVRAEKPAEQNREANEQKPADLVTKSASLPNLTGNTLAYAQAGDANRQNQMGLMCFHGQCMPQDKEQAVEWWLKAAEQGNRDAQISLSDAYRNGEGVAKDESLASWWLWRSSHATS